MCSADVLNKNNIPRDEEHPRMEQEDALHNLLPPQVAGTQAPKGWKDSPEPLR